MFATTLSDCCAAAANLATCGCSGCRETRFWAYLVIGALAVVALGLLVCLIRTLFRTRRERLERVSFLQQTSCDLKDPLSNIRLYTDLLERNRVDGDDSTRHEAIETIREETSRLDAVIEKLLEESRHARDSRHR